MDVIIGAGLSGLICAALNARAIVFERNKHDFVSHRAVLRFRDDKIARALGLTFRKVTVRKGVYDEDTGDFTQPNPQLANQYSQKVRGIISDNSLWNIATSERYIAPDNLHAILADICGNRVHWESEVNIEALSDFRKRSLNIINTTPLPILLQLLRIESPLIFHYAPIYVSRYTIPDCDVFQTIYFPSPNFSVYRATLTGSLLTIERTDRKPNWHYENDIVAKAFGIENFYTDKDNDPVHKQSFGKIAPVPDGERKALLHRLTVSGGIYSLGRFATWRNILLDDVYDDIAVIRRMMNLNHYDVSVERTKV